MNKSILAIIGISLAMTGCGIKMVKKSEIQSAQDKVNEAIAKGNEARDQFCSQQSTDLINQVVTLANQAAEILKAQIGK